MNPPANGTRDGQFVVFRGWDMPMHDIAYYPNLRGQLNNLKNIALSNPAALITAFNTNGWMKSCPAHDFSKWVQSSGTDLYVRVEYPGWYFIQGMDSPGNDIDSAPLATNVAAIMVNAVVNFPEDKSARVAGFNTAGWVKTRILPDLRHFSNFALDGLYVRTEFVGYEFFQGVDSRSGDITQRADLANNIPPLISASNSFSNSLGFNTSGWIKHTIQVPPPDRPADFNTPARGTHVRLQWPGFAYLPMLGSPAHDREQLVGKRIWELVNIARADSTIVAFNSNGWIKTGLADAPIEVAEQPNPLHGLYVKEPSLTALGSVNATAIGPNDVNTYLFIFKGTALIWGKWFLSDSSVRAEYNRAVAYGSRDIVTRMNQGSLTPAAAAQEAVNMRNQLLHDMRRQSSPLGRVIAQAIKPSGLPYQALLDRYAQRRYSRNFAQLTAAEASQVAGDTIDAAGRSNRLVTTTMRGVGYVSKALIGIGAAVSVYQVVTAQDWRVEIGHQVATWSGAIAGGELGAGVGAIVGPVGAIVGGLIGGIIGGLAGEGMTQLARWFFGGSSSLSAEEILGPALLVAANVAVREQLRQSGRNFYVHQILDTHVPKEQNADVDAAAIVQDMLGTKSEMRSDIEVVATIVWVVSSERVLPANGANPADLIALMQWAVRNLPST